MATFVDFKTVQRNQEKFRLVDAWGGTVRLNRLAANGVLEVQEVDEEDDMSFAVEFCARTIANEGGELQFDTDEGREFLKLEVTEVTNIVKELTSLHGLDEDEVEKKDE